LQNVALFVRRLLSLNSEACSVEQLKLKILKVMSLWAFKPRPKPRLWKCDLVNCVGLHTNVHHVNVFLLFTQLKHCSYSCYCYVKFFVPCWRR